MTDINLFESLLNCSSVEELHSNATAIARQMDDRIFPLSEKARKTSLFRPRKIYPVAKAEIDLGLRQNFLKSLRLMVKFLASLFSTEVRVS